MAKLGENIRNARLDCNLSQEQLAKMLGIKSGSVIYNWEKCTARPDIEKIPQLCEILHTTPDVLFGVTGEYPSVNEMTMVRKYRKLDEIGKKAVDAVLNVEYERAFIEQPKKKKARMLKLDFYNFPASAGTGSFLETEEPDEIWVRETPEAENADYVIPISGESMNPTFHDGDRVFVEKCDSVGIGEIGIFVINGEAYIKELGERCLISHNKSYKPIPFRHDDSIYCCGKVIGIVEE